MIELKNVTKKFANCVAIDNISLLIDKGIVGLVGQNGSGKSTILRLISNILYQDEGTILIDGFNNYTKKGKSLVFFLSDDPYVPYTSKVKDLIDLYSSFYNLNKDYFLQLVNKFGLPLNRAISTFSKGMKRQLFIALTLSIDVKYYLLDEAFDGLDPLIMEFIKTELLKLNEQGKVILISSHNISALQRLVNRFVIIYKGQISKDGLNDNMNKSLFKMQIMIDDDTFGIEQLKNINLKVVSFKKMGSIYNVVFFNKSGEEIKQKLKENFKIKLLEDIPMDSEEIISLEMFLARKENI